MNKIEAVSKLPKLYSKMGKYKSIEHTLKEEHIKLSTLLESLEDFMFQVEKELGNVVDDLIQNAQDQDLLTETISALESIVGGNNK